MDQRQGKDFLIRNLPIEVYNLLEKSSKEHHRSKTQEAIVALKKGLSFPDNYISQPKPFKWKEKPSRTFVERAIREGRE